MDGPPGGKVRLSGKIRQTTGGLQAPGLLECGEAGDGTGLESPVSGEIFVS